MSRLLTRFGLLIVLAATAYSGGVFSAAFETFPYPQLLSRPFQALKTRQKQADILSKSVVETDLWIEARYPDAKGVIRRKTNTASRGYTLYTAGDSAALLVDMRGEVVHRWQLPFREAWPTPPHVNRVPPESFIFWRRAQLMPNGDLIAIYTTTADSPYGYGLVRLDKHSRIQWKFADHVHHDFDVQPDGSVYALAQKLRFTASDPLPGFPQLPRQLLVDDLVHVSDDGEALERVSLLEAIVNSKYRSVLQMIHPKTESPASGKNTWDPMHANAVDVIRSDFAEHHEFAEPGQVLVSFRAFDAIGLVDMTAEKIVWMSRGFWAEQHDPDPLPNGHILVFDNNGHGGPGGSSRIIEYDPASNAIDWSYTGTREEPFWSDRRGSQQPLPSGGVLITSSQSGRVFEVNRAREIVWDFVHPARRRHAGKTYVPATCSGQRVEPENLTFEPGEPSPSMDGDNEKSERKLPNTVDE